MDKWKNLKLDKPCLFIVEGKVDRIILEILLDSIEFKDKVLIVELEGKDKLKHFKKTLSNTIKIQRPENLNKICLILDNDGNFGSAKQKAESFIEYLRQNIDLDSHIDLRYKIIPPENREFEDFLTEKIKQNDAWLGELEDCISKINYDVEKLNKKLFYIYLILKNDCEYIGTSFTKNQILRCLDSELMGLLREWFQECFENC